MNILLVAHRYPPDGLGGVERYTEGLARELRRFGDNVAVLSRRIAEVDSPLLMREIDGDGCVIYRIVAPDSGMDRFLGHYDQVEDLFEQVLHDTDPSVVHFNHLKDFSPRVLTLARKTAPIVLSLHDFYMMCPLVHLQKAHGGLCSGPRGGTECAESCFRHEETAAIRWPLRYAYYRRLLEFADRVVCPSEYVARTIERGGYKGNRLTVVPNGISVRGSSFPERPLPDPGCLRLASLGVVTRHKGFHVVLEAIKRVQIESVDYLVLGQVADVAYARELRSAAADIPGLRFRLFGAFDPSQLPLLLSNVDCVITSSIVPETFSLTTREALALGIPVIVSRIGALPEAVVEGQNGFSYDVNQPDQLASILREQAGNPAVLKSVRRAAFNTQVWSTSAHAEAMRELYRSLAEGPQPDRLSAADFEELGALFEALVAAGFT